MLVRAVCVLHLLQTLCLRGIGVCRNELERRSRREFVFWCRVAWHRWINHERGFFDSVVIQL